jgi:hypothetical protein
MDQHRRVIPSSISFLTVAPPFSCFDFVEDKYHGQEAIRRIFSLARSFEDVKTIVLEEILAQGIIEDENQEIVSLHKDFLCNGLHRISFWNKSISTGKDLDSCTDENLFGYALLKRDVALSCKMDRWYVFESVVRKYRHPHNCVPFPRYYFVGINGKDYRIPGILYCQQNNLNKVCAHVALRSLLSRILTAPDISYRSINDIAITVADKGWSPADGLGSNQIRKILETLGVGYRDIDYMKNPEYREILPYQKWLYAGVESGAGALVGFRLTGSAAEPDSRHIIPFFGHTFNKDTWAPDADFAYFRIGEGLGYIPSESWTSSFIGHDDNFGPNFCIPRFYIEQDKVEYVVELFRSGAKYSGVSAEALGLEFLYSILPHINPSENVWLNRLLQWTKNQRIVLRALSLEKEQYILHLQKLRDWNGNAEKSEIIATFNEALPPYLWIIEISTPHLFPANERKLGEIVLNASIEIKNRYETFQFARLPAKYLICQALDDSGRPVFSSQQSNIFTHTQLCSFD